MKIYSIKRRVYSKETIEQGIYNRRWGDYILGKHNSKKFVQEQDYLIGEIMNYNEKIIKLLCRNYMIGDCKIKKTLKQKTYILRKDWKAI